MILLLKFWISHLYMDYNARVKFIYNNYLKLNLYSLFIFVSVMIVGLFININYRLSLTISMFHLLFIFMISMSNNSEYFRILEREKEIKRREERLIREEQDRIRKENERIRKEKIRKEYEELQRKAQEEFIKYFFNNYYKNHRNNTKKINIENSNIGILLKILELPLDIRDFNVINKQHRKLVKLYHPDIYKDNGTKLKEINVAFDKLKKILK